MTEIITLYIMFFVVGTLVGALEGYNKKWANILMLIAVGFTLGSLNHGEKIFSLGEDISAWHWIGLMPAMWVPWHYTEKFVKNRRGKK